MEAKGGCESISANGDEASLLLLHPHIKKDKISISDVFIFQN